MEKVYHKNCGGEVFVKVQHSVEEIYEVLMYNTLIEKPTLKLGEPLFKILSDTKQILREDKISNYVCSKCNVILLEQDMQVKFKHLILKKGEVNG